MRRLQHRKPELVNVVYAHRLAGSKAVAGVSTWATTTGTTVTTTGGVSGYLPEFSGASTIVNSPLFVN